MFGKLADAITDVLSGDFEGSAPDTCDAGYVLPAVGEKCRFCGATEQEECKLYEDLSPKQIRQNEADARAGRPQERQ